MDFIIEKSGLLKSYFIYYDGGVNTFYLRSNGTLDHNMVINNKGGLGFFRRKNDAEKMLRAFKEGQNSNIQLSIRDHRYGPGLGKFYVCGRKVFYITAPNLKKKFGYFRRKCDAQYMLNAYESGQKNK